MNNVEVKGLWSEMDADPIGNNSINIFNFGEISFGNGKTLTNWPDGSQQVNEICGKYGSLL